MSDLRIAVHRAARGFRGGVEALAAAMSVQNVRLSRSSADELIS